MTLKRRLSQPGIVLSACAHVAVLVATLVAFSQSEKFDDQQETVPVEVITDNQFNQIMKGDKSAKAVDPKATAAVEQAESQAQPTPPDPTPPQPPAPPPPPPPPPTAAAEPPPPAVMPPPRPAMPEPEPPVPIPPVRAAEAPDAELPKPVPRPVQKPPPVPLPPVVPHVSEAKPHERPAPKPHPEKPKLDQLAKLMEQQPDPTPAPTPPKPAPPRPKPVQQQPQAELNHFDLSDIANLINRHDSQPSHPAASAPARAQTASLGSPTASAAKMSPSFWAGLDGLLEDQYRGCWSYLGLAAGSKYVPQVRVVYAQDGSLEGQPVLLNPPSDPSLQSLADSALRAVRRCNPLKIPEQYAPYYDQWRGRVLRFDPQEMAG